MRIVKKNGYYYLKHSFRKDGKVITREKYLGKTMPKNIDKIKQELKKEVQKSLYEKLEKIRDSFQKEWKRYPESAKQREKKEIAISFTYNTNAIEGSSITLEEAREIIVDKTAPNKPLKDIKETESHFKVFLDMLEKQERISKKLLLKWHEMIFRETKSDIAGRFRDFLVRVGPYHAPHWEEVENLMKNLFKFVNNTKLNPAELAARVHYRFEKIHPFGDGNGRVGRLIMNYILWHNGCPMLIIEYTKRRSYYKALQRDEDGFVNYFLRRYITVHRKRYDQS
ncbi:MAG: Fic family protein [Candidatus Aenigmarchaeota archaeon]|nr:Fic family protein [Candidatus Aenigmarchaeota archaeon]